MRTSGIVLGGIAAFAGLLAASLGAAQPPQPAPPAVQLVLGPGEGTATPYRTCCAHTGGGNVLVTQPAGDTIATSMTGVAVAKSNPLVDGVASYNFELTQDFEVVVSDPRVRAAKLLLEARVVGLLRTPKCCCGSPAVSASASNPAQAVVRCGPRELLALSLPPRSVTSGESLSVYNREGPVCVVVAPGKYTLHEVFGIQAIGSKWGGKGPSAEFAPDGALDPRWVSSHEPFHGAIKNSFGFQVILKVVPAEGLNPPGPVTSVPPRQEVLRAVKAP
jgi:hypothetical protein